MGKSKKPSKFIGSCGIYVIVECGDGIPWLLVHRRSSQVSEKNMIAGPGGIVERHLCVGPQPLQELGGLDFEAGAKATAVNELREETGVLLDATAIAQLRVLPVGEGTYWGEKLHRNYCCVLSEFPKVTGPEKASRHEIVQNGMNGIGKPAGDGWNGWVDVRELLPRIDCMKGCRVPLVHYLIESNIEFDPSLIESLKPAPVVAPVRMPAPRLAASILIARPAAPNIGLAAPGSIAALRAAQLAASMAQLAARQAGSLPAPAPVPIPARSGRVPLGCPPLPQEPLLKRPRGI